MNRPERRLPAPLGPIERHSALLQTPSEAKVPYKITSIENLLRSIIGSHLHFNCVDSYSDFSGADPNDSQQLPKDQLANAAAKFEKAPDFSAAHYYDQSRSRNYACCFSIENS
jgi:hypothetical protein